MEKYLILPDNTQINISPKQTYYEILKDIIDNNKYLGIKINNELMPLSSKAYKGGNVTFIDSNDLAGYKMYQAGLKLVLELALKRLYPKARIKYDHSIDRGIHITVYNLELTNNIIESIKKEMNNIISTSMPIQRVIVDKKSAFTYFEKSEPEKAINISTVPNSAVTLYKLDNYLNYYYTEMPPNTGCLEKYDLVAISSNELVLLFPTPRSNYVTPSYVHYQKVIDCYKSSISWASNLGISFVKDINSMISNGKVEDLIRLSELKYSNDLNEAVNKAIYQNAKFLLLAGPSSSGKTTSSKRLAYILMSKGYKPLTISVDDYFKERVDTPKDEFGHRDYESVNAIDIDLLTSDLMKLLDGKEITPPHFNFVTGKKEYGEKLVKLPPNGIIIMEGLHCLNDELLPNISNDLKYKIYLSPFYPVNIDNHNYIHTTDIRKLRRIVRDSKTRGRGALSTLNMWSSIRKGEAKNIYPYQDRADIVINSSLIYEVGVLKTYVEPLLFCVNEDDEVYSEALRLINFLRNFVAIPSDDVPIDSVLREFIGGSCFED